MIKHTTILSLILLFLSAPVAADGEIDKLIITLDNRIEQRDTYRANRVQRIESLMALYKSESSSAERLYALNERLIEEYITFQADSAISLYQQNLSLARTIGDMLLFERAAIGLAHFYASTGLYYEASEILSRVDTLSLPQPMLLDYYISQQKLNDELRLYSNDATQASRSLRLAKYYNREILRHSDIGSYTARCAELWSAIQRGDDESAVELTQQIMEQVPELSREWATAAFMRALVEQNKSNSQGFIEWMIRSALVDMQLGIRDYAALKSIASHYSRTDVERSMRYMRVVMDDVQAFNSRLRPWQDAMILPEIEKGYHSYTERMAAEHRLYIYLLTALVIVVVLLLIYVVFQNRRLRDVRRTMRDINLSQQASVEELREATERLTKLNVQITEANGVKEEYIGIFLQVCSEHIDKIVAERRQILKQLRAGKAEEIRKQLDTPELEHSELKQFYNLFDSTFLRLYPTFVEELNELLAEDSQIIPRKGEYLNTELRIFALIRLGISDTPRIASLLHYSLSTIYNYRSRIRYREGITREEFERRLRTIGSFNR